eukprot:TRINITY_DN10589_c0_g1_i1.p1 TRINITY_DN10589_c0_g1~~TRINITY_DN10589_c0_g1_i1.p1  ORF type:complete len:271 (-),score=40.19 TRINITY_DN10589_c0_g1_i1:66-878(-)
MFISTRVTKLNQTLTPDGCQLENDPRCHYVTLSSNMIYIADIEAFTMLINHAMFVPGFGMQANSIDLPGALLDSHGHPIHNLPVNNSVGEKGKDDILDVSLILRAAGIESLDNVSLQDASRTKRNNGIVLLFFITYSNTYSYNPHDIRYQYTVKQVADTKFKATQPIYTKHIENLEVWDRHGIRIIFIQVGTLGKFDFQTLLLTFVSGLGLLAVASVIVDFIALRLLRSKSLYRKYKYVETPEYMDVAGHRSEETSRINTTEGTDTGIKV